ncbi:MAG: hypothetical protein R6X20_00275 [Phycisphaerae bacterium]
MDVSDDPMTLSPEAEEADRPRHLAGRALVSGLAGLLLPVVGLVPALVAVWCGWHAMRRMAAEARTAAEAGPTLFDVLTPDEDRLGAYFARPRGKAVLGFALGLAGVGLQVALVYLVVGYWI